MKEKLTGWWFALFWKYEGWWHWADQETKFYYHCVHKEAGKWTNIIFILYVPIKNIIFRSCIPKHVFVWRQWQVSRFLVIISVLMCTRMTSEGQEKFLFSSSLWAKQAVSPPLRWLWARHTSVFLHSGTGRFLFVFFLSGSFIFICSHSSRNEQAFTTCLEEVLFFIRCKCLESCPSRCQLEMAGLILGFSANPASQEINVLHKRWTRSLREIITRGK